ncbi:MAG: hypothetical protein IJX60_05160, partial [Paludibacteraceae bacterium]|nr:hypothetical protein [Paludibacteraceae bacterium]
KFKGTEIEDLYTKSELAKMTIEQRLKYEEDIMTRNDILNSISEQLEDARKEAKRLTKEGFVVFAGDLPMAKQLDRSYMMEYEYVQSAAGSIVPKYLVGRGMATGENYSAAQNAAKEIAKDYVAGLAEIEITSITEITLANREDATATSLAEVVSASKNIVSKRLGEVLPVVTVFKETKKHEVTVAVRVVYDRNTVLQTYKEVIREELEKKGDKLHEQLDQALGF